jgi:acetyl-CoA acetyltransferase
MTGVAVAGVGIHPFGRFVDKTVTDLGVDAVRAALAEAGVGTTGLEAAFCGTAYGGVASGHKVLGRLGMTGMPIIDVEAGCASGAAALMLAAASIRSGQHDTVLAFGIEKMPKGIIRSSFFEPWQEEAGLTSTPAYFALRAQRLMVASGVTEDDLAAVVVKNRRHGSANPDAMFRTEVTAEAVLQSRVVCPPLRLWMLCSPNEGAAAVVLRRSDSGRTEVQIRSSVVLSHLPGPVLSESTPLSGLCDDTIPSPSARAAQAAYDEAGVGPGDLDLVECQDTDAARELLAYEELGLCEPGCSPSLILGASALGQVVELVRQLRGEAGGRQVEDARIGLAHTIGRGANASVVILGR